MRKGFTLIETIIYAAILALTIGFVLSATYQIILGSEDIERIAAVEEEANFILGKFRWAMASASDINSPASGVSGDSLSIDRFNYNDNPVEFDLNGTNIRIQKNNGGWLELNSERTIISNLEFTHIASVGDRPAGVRINLDIQDYLEENERVFETTIYLHE
ncbi:MAG: prepilin-type N-terminal cleavage/methylation domain-containing protein [Candidatus Colwellbacteria bacterium]|nr:prepilin-type N-terminal cleavage/methylation domain-containing protein [Candidatus Colwellbacteria bacterium]